MVRAPNLSDRGLIGALPGAITDRDILRAFEVDWTGQYQGRAAALVRPTSTAETAAAVAACAAAGLPIVPQGGNTGLVGGSVPDASGRAVIVSTTNLHDLGPVDATTRQVTLGAGVTLGRAQRHVRAQGFDMAVDLSARDTATVGGMVATNAGGIHVLRHGTMRHQLMGVEAVLADGSVLSHLAGLEKDNTGYDLAGLLCGSEGTLGVITRVRLRVVALPAHRVTCLTAWPDIASMVEGLTRLRAHAPDLEAAEYMTGDGVELVRSVFGLPSPFERPSPVYLLLSLAGPSDPTPQLQSVDGASDVAVAATERQAAAMWELRDRHTEAVASVGPPRKYDVTVPLPSLASFLEQGCATVTEHGGRAVHWGHAGDGNVHLNVLGGTDVDAVVLGLVASHGGSISAEHGIGRLKREWLHLSRTPPEIAAMAAIKQALDPRGVLNPGVLLPG